MNIEYGPDHAVVTLVSLITDEAVIELAAAMTRLQRDYFYDQVHLEIASPGGMETALSHWLAVADDLRADGLRIVTRGLTSVGSAAAVMLSLGDRREAGRNTRLLYHGMRIESGGALSARGAAYHAELMERVDRDVLARLADRALEAARGDLPAWEMAVEDRLAAPKLARGVDWPGRAEFAASGGKAGDALACLRRLVAWCAEGPRERFAALYGRLLQVDQTISAPLALELALIDAIVGGRGDGERERPKAAFRVPHWSGGGFLRSRPRRRKRPKATRNLAPAKTALLRATGEH